ncbi:aldose 1-epimerase [Paenibacillus physcomitrellae]|uniref:Galactose mutarotase n=1 Tax=Paenibacillus physcomitrellae TaxID=1619311 RepID=A0ABQ1GB98_9BACL|nr:aldose 1-epimerase [Paenibacillus physcomitrellae]GGA40336.1 galactose mutarotase [Paenibacillus physcomitrellae]
MNQYQAYEGTYQGEKAIWLKAGSYEAVMLPDTGGNLIAFKDKEKGFSFLREPEEGKIEEFKASPGVYGIPVLFPPNRYEDGKFPWNGQTLQFPVNEEATGNHLHGFLHTVPWEIEEFGTTEHESYVTVKIRVDEKSSVYSHFPFVFTVKLRYSLGVDGLSQHVFIKNEGEQAMPRLLAFHTAVNAPFSKESQSSDYAIKLTIGERWELSERMLPTGRHQALSAFDLALKGEGVYPFAESMDNHYTAAPQQGRNRMELTDSRLKLTLIYDVGTSYKQWMIWNNGGTPGFFCPEPQMNLVNAPNVDLPAEEIGLFSLEPGEIWEETARFYVKEVM